MTAFDNFITSGSKKSEIKKQQYVHGFYIYRLRMSSACLRCSPTSGATKTQPHMRCSKTRPDLEIVFQLK